MEPHGSDRVSIERLPSAAWAVAVVLGLSVIYLVLQVTFVRPYLWPAGHGLRLAGDSRFAGGSDERAQLLARPPAIREHPAGTPVIRDIYPGSPAASQDLRPGDALLTLRSLSTNRAVDLSAMAMADRPGQIEIWRDTYRLGLQGELEVRVQRGDGRPRDVVLARTPVWRASDPIPGHWARRHLGMMVQIVVFIGGSLVLFMLRTTDVTAAFCVLALTLSAVGGGGPLMGVERALPAAFAAPLTVFSWIAGPLAFPSIALAILYFPARSQLLVRYRWLHFVPFVAAAPMIALGLMTGLYLAGLDAARPGAVVDAAHPNVYFASFAVALAVNVLAVGEGFLRYRTLAAPAQRRVRLAMYTVVPGVLAYVVKDGLPIASLLAGRPTQPLPWWLIAVLQTLILLPAIAVTYAVAVHRVLGPRMVLRRSLQYAFARRTLGIAAAIPFTALTVSLVQARHRTLADVVRGAPAFYITLIVLCLVALKYRDRARGWLDQRFFRDEYDAQKILLSLASRVRFETDPSELSALVVHQIDEALHPRTVAILATGIEEGRLTPIAVPRGGAIEPLPLEGGLVSMLRWSHEPLEVFLDDPRSGVRRLPPEEQAWLQKAGIALLVPILGEDRSLVAVIALAERLSDEPYTAEDRELLASIAAQVGLALDVARLRRRMRETAGIATPGETTVIETPAAMSECPQCGLCQDASVMICPADGTTLARAHDVPRVIERKFRLDQRIGRGGMGAVYRARDVRLDRDVAIKVVRADLLGDPDARRRFRREAQIVARLQHPSIVSVFDYGTFPDGGAYLVMELVRGEDLRRLLTREGRLPPPRAARILSQICAAIDEAHREGVLHRDLKPENVLMVGGDCDVKVLDFGVAKLVREDRRHADGAQAATLTVDGTVVGTPAYMAPEQLRGEPLDARSDVFSLGVMAYEMLSGVLPFGRGSLADIVLRQAKGAPPLRSEVGEEITPALEQAVQTALGMEPTLRPPSPSAFSSLVRSAVGVSA
jgi:tRNA A-37 threonylcarbamoyl transferase component Bud32